MQSKKLKQMKKTRFYSYNSLNYYYQKYLSYQLNFQQIQTVKKEVLFQKNQVVQIYYFCKTLLLQILQIDLNNLNQNLKL